MYLNYVNFLQTDWAVKCKKAVFRFFSFPDKARIMVVEQSVKSAAADGETVAALPMLPRDGALRESCLEPKGVRCR